MQQTTNKQTNKQTTTDETKPNIPVIKQNEKIT